MPAPRITITCDCGEQRKLAYGESYTCECGKSWSTAQVPAADYEAIKALDRRYRRLGWVGIGGFGLVCLGVAVFGKPITLLLLIPAGMMTWFTIFRPMVRRRHWRAIQALTRRWTLRAE
ncbi:MAG TPA: hypothetical protein VFD90_07150 [Gaiellales bacterium]|nr:hypothetical protein [Gaiellales bacterium]